MTLKVINIYIGLLETSFIHILKAVSSLNRMGCIPAHLIEEIWPLLEP
jgi:hypothetical protein